jgi:hypothetical protein
LNGKETLSFFLKHHCNKCSTKGDQKGEDEEEEVEENENPKTQKRKREEEEVKCHTEDCDAPAVYPNDYPSYCAACSKCPRCPRQRGVSTRPPKAPKVSLRSTCLPCYKEGRGKGKKRYLIIESKPDDDKTDDDETDEVKMGAIEQVFADLLQGRTNDIKKFQGNHFV